MFFFVKIICISKIILIPPQIMLTHSGSLNPWYCPELNISRIFATAQDGRGTQTFFPRKPQHQRAS